MDYLESLNPQQRDAVTAPDGPMLVIAGAGSGKTRVLTMRIAYLLSRGVKPYNIMALTFTNKAAREMKERVANIVGQQQAAQLWMGTFHSIFARILRIEADKIGFTHDFTIYDTQDSKSLITGIIKSLELNDKEYKPNMVCSVISKAKNELITPKDYANDATIQAADQASRRPQLVNIYQQYVKNCRAANALDFDDLLLYTNVLLRDNPDVLEKYQQRFTHILVDEFQDTNKSQYIIVKRLAAQSHNICVVGDDAQSIYSFRGAKIENILRFSRDYPEYKLVKLEQNYRSTQNIVNAANSLIANNAGQIQKRVFSHNDEGDRVKIVSLQSDIEEAAYVAGDIARRMHNEQLTPSAFAILYRTNAQSRVFEETLRRKNIPYKIYGGLSFYQRKEIKDVLAYLRLTVNHYDNEAIKRIINYPGRGIGATTLQKIQQCADHNNAALWEVITSDALPALGISPKTIKSIREFTELITTFETDSQQLEAYKFAAEVVSKSGIMRELNSGGRDEESRERLQNVNELLNALQDYSNTRSEEGQDSNIRGFLEEVALITDLDNDKEADADTVKLMTIHTSKGLEFDSVYIAGVEEDIFPSHMSLADASALEEERRLFYVALTRAMHHATVSYTRSRYQYGERRICQASRFVKEIDTQYVDNKDADTPLSDSITTSSTRPSPYGRPGTYTYAPKNLTHITPDKPSYRQTPQPAASARKGNITYKAGMQIVHDTFGHGVIQSIEGEGNNAKLIVTFEHYGTKHLLLKFARVKPLG